MKLYTLQRNLTFTNYALILILTLATCMNGARAADHERHTKVGSNVLTMIGIGDANLNFETGVSDQISLVSSIHYVSGTKVVPSEGRGVRASVGMRGYKEENMKGIFVELKGGLNYYKDASGTDITGRSLSPSFELFLGQSNMFNDVIFYDFKAGVMRVLNTGTILPGLGFSIGAKF
ncbi:MAG: hypothetical protein OEZ43_03240 [Gammaproteobacteria bacterium]|nr:hypothetical protein [Gammaproteobacteria bacterium]